MKWNKFISVIKQPQNSNNSYIINYYNGQLIYVVDKLAELVINNTNNIENIFETHPTFAQELYKKGFIVDKNLDIPKMCIEKLNNYYTDRSEIRLTINPTLDCNLRCWYCYEEHKNGTKMSADIIESILKYLELQLIYPTKKLILSFFGGEPLICYNDVVLILCSKIKELCTRNNIELIISFTTNGTLLTKSRIEKLLSIHNNLFFQIPFDGSGDTHNLTKHFKNKNGSYDLILKNVKSAITHKGVEINIRCNYTLNNIESFRELINEFKTYTDYSNFYFDFHRVWQEKETSILKSKLIEIQQYTINTLSKNHLLTIKPTRCYADNYHNIIINYDGGIYKCTARDFNDRHIIGHINKNGTITQIFRKIEDRNSKFILPCCKECKILPICNICGQKKDEFIDGNCPFIDNSDYHHQLIYNYLQKLLTNSIL